MDLNQLRLSIEADLAETHKLLTVATRPVVRESLVQLFTTLEQARLLFLLSCTRSLCHVFNCVYSLTFV